MFKKGDRVRCINDGASSIGGLKNGDVYTVKESNLGEVKLEENGIWWSAHRFVLVGPDTSLVDQVLALVFPKGIPSSKAAVEKAA